MDNAKALARADELLKTFIETQDIPGGGTKGTATEHGEKTAQVLIGIHRTLHEYFRRLDDGA